MEWGTVPAVFFFGLFVGSFLNVCIVRLPKGQSVVWPRSRCPRCSAPIAWYDNIPVLSFILLQGKCRRCHQPIARRYPLVELVTAALSLATYLHFHAYLPYALYFCFFVAPLIVVAFIDLEHQIIPDAISLPGIAVGFLVRAAVAPPGAFADEMIDAAIGTVAGGGVLWLVGTVYEKLKKHEGLGGGDVKLAAMLGAFLGWKALCFILLVSSFLGSVVGITMIVFLRKGLKYAIPFGPFLVAGALLYLFFGDAVLGWYLGLFYHGTL